MSNLKQRIVTATIAAPIALGVLWVGGIPFMVLMGLVMLQLLREWFGLTKRVQHKATLNVLALPYIIVPCLGLVWMRGLESPDGLLLVLNVLFIVWATDIGAYIAGRKIGGPKIAPKISPNKTWAGLVGGIVSAGVVSLLFILAIDGPAPVIHGVLGAGLAIVAQAGDFFESWVKRKAGVKDSGNILPGHGGLLDRLDGLLSVSLATTLILLAQ